MRDNPPTRARLALASRVLLHDGQALLHQLGLRRALRFVDTHSPATPGIRLTPDGLAVQRVSFSAASGGAVSNNSGWSALGDPHAGRLNMPARFADWWNDAVIQASQGDWWSRGRLVLAMSNTDGGAHVDPMLAADYIQLLDDRLGMTITIGGETVPMPAREWAEASMRQIAHELVRTIQRDWRTAALIEGTATYEPPRL